MSEAANILAGRASLVTGAGRGTGEAVARALAAAGARVCVNDLNPDRARRVAEEIVASGGEAFARQGDVTNKFQAAAAIEAARDRYGSHLAILVHNAHVSPAGPALKMDEWDVRRTVEVNLTGAFVVAQLAARVMAHEGGGVIVLLTRQGEQAGAVFAATQAALGGLADALDAELREQGVRVHAVPVAGAEDTAARVLAVVTARQ